MRSLRLALIDLIRSDRRGTVLHLQNALRVLADDLELQIGAGRLLREMGQPDRAIEVHLSVLGRPSIDERLRVDALFELALDYKSSGIFDRALDSASLLEGSPRDREATGLKLDIFQRRADWSNALFECEKYLNSFNAELSNKERERLVTARFHLLIASGRSDEARRLLPGHARLSDGHPSEAKQTDLLVCRQCGYSTRAHSWQCPGCYEWDSLIRAGS
jgi:lipopolysaccharide biosynthesis regulator YciM